MNETMKRHSSPPDELTKGILKAPGTVRPRLRLLAKSSPACKNPGNLAQRRQAAKQMRTNEWGRQKSRNRPTHLLLPSCLLIDFSSLQENWSHPTVTGLLCALATLRERLTQALPLHRAVKGRRCSGFLMGNGGFPGILRGHLIASPKETHFPENIFHPIQWPID